MIVSEPAKRGKRAFRLHITITLVFVILTLPVTLIFGIITYRANEQLIVNHTDRFVQKTLSDQVSNFDKLLSPMINSIRSASTLMRDNADYFRGESSADYLQEMVMSHAGIQSAYAAFADGSLREVRRAVQGESVLQRPIPADTQFISRFLHVQQMNGIPAVDSYSFQAHWGVPIGDAVGSSATTASEQDFYKDAMAAKAIHISEPYVMNSGDLGMTIASPVLTDQHASGVIAVDVNLKTLSQFLSDNRAAPNSLSLLVNEGDEIIAHPHYASGIVKKGSATVPARLTKLDDPRVLAAIGERLRSGRDRFTFRAGADNIEYLALFSAFPEEYNKSWEVITITPTADFVGEIQSTNRDLLIFSLIAFFVQIALIYMISRMIARPIEQLAREVMDIREFRFDKLKRINSPVTEIRHLSDAIALLERALESFISYVPTVLVKQLMESGQGAKLGVESRFLTVFFTDIEGFSSLSESQPSQQLLSHVSDYFATVTRAIEREQGTVDKFIGDAVMAFWGAPKVLDNHAYLACVAAIRSQRGMMKLNQEWMAQKMPPLKLRIGIHCDAVLVGNIGSPERVSYTVMGDGVNVAARLEGINKEMGTWICVSHNVYREAGHLLCLRPVDTVTVKGRKGELLVYELLGTREGDAEIAASFEQLTLCEATSEAYAEYANGRFDEAAAAYAKILEHFPNDPVAQRMLEKSRAQTVKLVFA